MNTKQSLHDIFWINQQNSKIELGLTKETLKNLGQLWQYIPKLPKGKLVEPNDILATVETIKCLKPLRSPIKGKLIQNNSLAQERPDSITEETVLFIFSSKESNALPSM